MTPPLPSLRLLLAQLQQEGFAAVGDTPLPGSFDTAGAHDSPWFVRVMVGVSAWIAAGCLLSFISIVLSASGSAGMIVCGLLLYGTAVGVRRLVSQSVFIGQLTLVGALAGQLLLIGGVGLMSSSPLNAALTLIVSGLVLVVIFPDAVMRFFSAVAIPWAIIYLLYDMGVPAGVHGLVALLGAMLVIIWERESAFVCRGLFGATRPIGYGLAVALVSILCLSATQLLDVGNWWISALLLLPAVLYVAFRSASTPQAGTYGRKLVLLLVVICLLVGVPAVQTPGLLAALLLLLLGFWRGDLALVGLAVVALALFLVLFYYGLAATLLVKSVSLVAIGLVMLGAHVLLVRLLPREEAQ